MLIKQIYQKNATFEIIGILKILVYKYEPYFSNGCHDLMQKAMSFKNITIVYTKGSVYRIHFWHMSKDDTINIMNDSNLVDKRGAL